MENSIEVPQKTKNRCIMYSIYATPGYIYKRYQIQNTIYTLSYPCLLQQYSQYPYYEISLDGSYGLDKRCPPKPHLVREYMNFRGENIRL